MLSHRRFVKRTNNNKELAPQDYLEQANINYNLGIYTKAALFYTHALSQDPNFIQAYFNRGLCKFAQGLFKHAVKDFHEVLQRDPTNANAYANLGITRFRQGFIEAALTNLDQAVKLNPDIALVYQTYGLIYSAKQPEMALQALTRAIQLDPDSLNYQYRGNAYAFLGQFEDAMLDYARAYQKNPDGKIVDLTSLETCLQKCKNFSAIPKDVIFGLIIKLPDFQKQQSSLLIFCLHQGNPLGDRMWEVDFPVETRCSFDDGTLKDICDYMRKNNPRFVTPNPLGSVTEHGIFQSPSRNVTVYKIDAKPNGNTVVLKLN